MNRHQPLSLPTGITETNEIQVFEQLTAFSHTSQTSVSFFNEKFECVWECLPQKKFCSIFPAPNQCSPQCLLNLQQARQASSSMSDPFISLCACSHVLISYPLITGRVLKGTFYVGPVMMGLNRDAAIRKLVRSCPSFMEFSAEIISFIEQNSIRTPLEVSYLYEVFCNSISASMRGGAENLDDLYVSNLFHAVCSGSDETAEASFHVYYEKTYLTDLGSQNRIRTHLLELFDHLAEAIGSDIFLSVEYLDALEAVKKSFTRDDLYQNAKNLVLLITHGSLTTFYHGSSVIIRDAIAYIEENYDQDITLSSAAASVNVNASYLSSLIKKETGYTFSQYLNRIRLSKSLPLLADTHLSITTISMMCGFSNQSYYIKNFKEHYHKTPGQYRREILKR